MKVQCISRCFLGSIFLFTIQLSLFSCVDYHQGAYSDPNGLNQVPQIKFQSTIFFVDPPIKVKMSESCLQTQNLNWKPNLTSSPSQTQKLPTELQTDFERSTKASVSKVQRRSKVSKNEFSLTPTDISIYRNNPNPLEVLESLNIFSEDVFPKKINGEDQRHTPDMLLRYMKYVNDNSSIKISSVMTIAKVAGGFYGQCIGQDLVSAAQGIEYGAAVSVAIMIKFQNKNDKQEFQNDFGLDTPFSELKTSAYSDTDMSQRLVKSQAQIEISVAEIGGDIEKTKAFVSKISCGIDDLSSCRKARHDIIRYIFDEELRKPESFLKTNGWIPVSVAK